MHFYTKLPAKKAELRINYNHNKAEAMMLTGDDLYIPRALFVCFHSQEPMTMEYCTYSLTSVR